MVAVVIVVGSGSVAGVTGLDAVAVVSHADAWERAAALDGPALVMVAGARLRAGLDGLIGALGEQPWDLLDLAGDVAIGCVVTPSGAARLARDEPVEVLTVDPPLVTATRLVTTTPADLATVLVTAEDEEVILAIPDDAVIVGGSEAVLDARGRLRFGDGAVGEALIASAWRLREVYRAGGGAAGNVPDLPGDTEGVVFHPYTCGASDTVVLDGRVRNVATGTEPAVVLPADADARAQIVAALADTGSRDLTRLLAYRDAVDPSPYRRRIAPELVELAFWTPEFCATIVRAAEAVGAFAAHEDDPVPGTEVSLASISPRLFAHVEDDLAGRVVPALAREWPAIEYFGLRDAFVIKYVAGRDDGLRLHHDVAQISGAVKLNQGYEGGALEFPRQGVDTADVPIGHLVAWPSLVTHPHCAATPTAGVKYSLTIWLELPSPEDQAA